MAEASAWMPLYVGDYLGDTQRLTTEQHGAYLLLLMDYWRNGAPPDDDAVLAQITRMAIDDWKRIRRVIVRFFDEEDGLLFHGRVEIEISKAKTNHDRRVERSKKASQARWGDVPKNASGNAPRNARRNAPRNASSTDQAMPEAMLVDCSPPSPSPSSDNEELSDAAGVEDEFDPVKALFDDGIRVLKKAGSSEKTARSLIGRWRKDFGDDLTALAVAAAESRAVSQPLEWIPKYLSSRKEAQPEQREKRGNESFVDHVLAEAEAAKGKKHG